MVSRNCQQCGAPFTTSAAKIREGNGKFCSRKCSHIGRRKAPPKIESYLTVFAPEHPLTAGRSGGRIWAHRVALYDKIGPGVHDCFHCGTPVEWTFGIKRGGLVVDHLDGNRRNNAPENLVPSCNRCNCIVRVVGKMISDDEPFILDSGKRRRAVELTCPCGRTYLKVKSQAHRSKYCSTTCRNTYSSRKRWASKPV